MKKVVNIPFMAFVGSEEPPTSSYSFSKDTIPPPITNEIISKYTVFTYTTDGSIPAVWATSIAFSTELQCFKIREAFEQQIKKTNKNKRKNYYQIPLQFPEYNKRVNEYINKKDEFDKYVYSLICSAGLPPEENKYFLRVGLVKEFTLMDFVEKFLIDMDNIDTSGL